MSKLHEILAVESNLENQANKCRTDLLNTFEKRRVLFEEKKIVFTPSTEGEQETVESQLDIQSNIPKEITWISQHIAKALDASYQVAEANTRARADVELEDGAVVLRNVPATSLLELEKKLAEVHALVAAIPTLDPTKGFVKDESRSNIYKAREVVKVRTRKGKRVIVLYNATTEHPAQTQLIDEDLPVGKLREQEWSGLITPAAKSEMLDRAEILIRAVRKARSRANDIEVDSTQKIGNTLLKYVFSSVTQA